MRMFSATLTVLVMLVAMAATAAADPLSYTDRTTFDAASGGGLSFESFEGTGQSGASVTYGDLTFTESGGINAFTHTALNSYFSAATTDGSHSIWYHDNTYSVSTLTFTFASPVNAFGLDIATSAASTVAIGGSITGSIALSANTSGFFGVIDTSSAGFTSITFTASGAPLVGFDAVSYGTAPAPVPEPATFALLGLGLAGMAARRRRKSRA